MNFSKIFFSTVLTLSFIAGDLMAKEPDKVNGSAPTGTPQAVSWREACVRPTKQIELDVNNVRARIISGGTVWEAAEYIVPKPQPEVCLYLHCTLEVFGLEVLIGQEI
ncbi:MAG: hypothetical protein LC127_14690 [Chitinophagales bacterium]|nr:hypothetical protein [Chitinophagales bacterium]